MGRTIRCPRCKEFTKVPTRPTHNNRVADARTQPDDSIAERKKMPVQARLVPGRHRPHRRGDEDHEKIARKQSDPAVLWVGIGAGILGLIALAVLVVVIAVRKSAEPVVADNSTRPVNEVKVKAQEPATTTAGPDAPVAKEPSAAVPQLLPQTRLIEKTPPPVMATPLVESLQTPETAPGIIAPHPVVDSQPKADVPGAQPFHPNPNGKVVFEKYMMLHDPPHGTLSGRIPANQQIPFSMSFDMDAGTTYMIDLKKAAGGVDPYVYLADDKKLVLVEDDNSGGNLDARIIFTPAQSGSFTVIGTSVSAFRGDWMRLTIADVTGLDVAKSPANNANTAMRGRHLPPLSGAALGLTIQIGVPPPGVLPPTQPGPFNPNLIARPPVNPVVGNPALGPMNPSIQVKVGPTTGGTVASNSNPANPPKGAPGAGGVSTTSVTPKANPVAGLAGRAAGNPGTGARPAVAAPPSPSRGTARPAPPVAPPKTKTGGRT